MILEIILFNLLVSKKIGFSHYFIRSVKILLESQESCIINAGTTAPYFNLEKGARQGHLVSAYLFILCLEVLVLLAKANHKIWGVNIFQYTFLYTAYADDTTFFLKIKNSIKEIMKTCSTFSQYSSLKPTMKNVKLQELES